MLKTAELSPELATALEEERASGEQLLWAAQHKPSSGSDMPGRWTLFVIGAIIIVAACYCVSIAVSLLPYDGSAYVLLLIGIIIGAGGWTLLKTAFRNPRSLLQTGYAVTTKRVLIIELIGGRREVRSFVPRDANLLKRIERQDGGGDLLLGTVATNMTGYAQNIALLNVDDVRGVERLVRETFFADAGQDER